MPISIGIYDFFSYTIPGVIYLLLFWETYRLSTGITIPIDFGNIGQILLVAGLSYLVGVIISPVPRLFWRLLFFRKESSADAALERTKSIYPDMEISFKGRQWPVIFAHIRSEKPDYAANIDKSLAMSIMLRNISFGILWFGCLQNIMLFKTGNVPFYGSIIILSIVFLVTAVWLGLKFEKQFYWKIFEYAISTQLPIGEWVKLKTKGTSVEPPKPSKSRAGKRV